MHEIVTVALIGAGGPVVVALTALTLHFRLFDSLGRRIAVIESETSVATLTDEEQKVHSSSRPGSPLGERLSLLDTRAVLASYPELPIGNRGSADLGIDGN